MVRTEETAPKAQGRTAVRTPFRGLAAGKLAATATAVALVGAMALPAPALAAESLGIGESRDKGSYGNYTEAANGNGWSWDGGDNLALDNYDGMNIWASGGDLTIWATGENTPSMVNVPDGNLSIVGTDENASLGTWAGGLEASGDINVSNVELDINASFTEADAMSKAFDQAAQTGNFEQVGEEACYAIDAGGAVTLDKVTGTINAAGEDLMGQGPEGTFLISPGAKNVSGVISRSGNVTVKNSDLAINVTAQDCYGIESRSDDSAATMLIDNSSLRIDAPVAAVVAWSRVPGSKLNVVNSQINGDYGVVDIAADGLSGQTLGSANVDSLTSKALAANASTTANNPDALKKETIKAPLTAKSGSAAASKSNAASAASGSASATKVIAASTATPAAATQGNGTALAQTGDDAGVVAGIAALAAALSAGMLALRRRFEA